jgi:hypothetical protein
MMPTFPRSPLSFRTAGFPRYGWKAGLSDGAFPAIASLKSAPDMHVATTGLHPPFVHSAARAGSPFLPGPQARSCTAMKWLAPQPQGPSLESGLCCPGPSSLNRPHPSHARAHRDFAAWRLIRGAFAVRERRGDPRVVPSFRCLFLPDMPSSASPGSSTSPCPISRCRHGLRHGLTGSTLPILPQSDSRGRSISGLTNSPLLRPVSLLASPCRIRPGLLPAHRRLLRPGFRRVGYPSRRWISLRHRLDSYVGGTCTRWNSS